MRDRIRPTLLIEGQPYPARAYDLGSVPFIDLNSNGSLFPSILWNVSDTAIADFNGDGLADLFVSRANFSSGLLRTDAGLVSARIIANADEKGFTCRSADDVHIFMEAPATITPNEVFIGSEGRHPDSLNLTLSSQDSTVVGVAAHDPGTDQGVFIGYDPAAGLWRFLVSRNEHYRVDFTVTSDSGISDVTPIGFSDTAGELPDALLTQTEDGFTDGSATAGLTAPTQCESVTAADFDNDMDVDIYAVCETTLVNAANLLYENVGNGVFRKVIDAGGAAGSMEGRGDSVAAADYDNDGFVDLFVTNGTSSPPVDYGPSQLFHNRGNSNYWLEINLQGVQSNRDAIGARVLVRSGGVTQVREQNGGMHRYSQNHQRLHFGLGQNQHVDSIEISWPSGTRQTLRNLRADQIVTVIERDIDNDTPIIGGTGLTNIKQGDNYNFRPSASDPDGDTLVFTITNRPSWAALDPLSGTLSGTPSNADVGVYPDITIAVDDQQGQVNSLVQLPAFTITVNNVNDAPLVVSPIGSGLATQGAPFGPLDVSTNFSDPDGDPLSFSVMGLPTGTGLTMSSSGLISGQPTEADALASPIDMLIVATDTSNATTSVYVPAYGGTCRQ